GRLFIVTNRFQEEGAFEGKGTIRKDLDAQLKSLANLLQDARREGLPPWMLITSAALIAVALAVWVARQSARPYKTTSPRYARPTPLVAQGGVAGRFALLAAPSSPRSLALLELKSALMEAVAFELDLPPDPSPDRLFSSLVRAGSLDE